MESKEIEGNLGCFFNNWDNIRILLGYSRDIRAGNHMIIFYSHMKTESLVDLKDLLNRGCQANAAPDVQNKSIHTHTHTKIVNFGEIKNTGKSINTRLSGI